MLIPIHLPKGFGKVHCQDAPLAVQTSDLHQAAVGVAALLPHSPDLSWQQALLAWSIPVLCQDTLAKVVDCIQKDGLLYSMNECAIA